MPKYHNLTTEHEEWLGIVLTITLMRWEWAIDNLIAVWNVVVKIASTLLVKVSTDVHVPTVCCTVTAQSRSHAAWCYITVAFCILSCTWYGHFLGFAISDSCSLLDLLVILILLQVSVCLRVSVILLVRAWWETASHGILVLSIKTVLDVNTLIVDAAVCVVYLLYTASRRCERMCVYLRIEAGRIISSLNHI